jgi:hypothetical protein
VRIIGPFFLALGLPIAGWGIWLVSTEDVQGGRHGVGAIWLAVGGFLVLLGVVLLALSRDSRS